MKLIKKEKKKIVETLGLTYSRKTAHNNPFNISLNGTMILLALLFLVSAR